MKLFYNILIGLSWCIFSANAINIDFNSKDSINNGLSLLAKGLMDYYNGNDTGKVPGMFVEPYYWWEAGAAWGSMLDYWYYTGDETYNGLLKSSLLFQTGPGWDYMPSNQTTTEGNDDQGFWGITVMAAAEKNFSNPNSNEPGWAYLAQAVFNTMAARWDNQHCGGGLRWQIFTWNNGYNYKNSVSNGCFFNLAARLARYTDNSTYVEWADRIWNWMVELKFIDTHYQYWPVYDGAGMPSNCTKIDDLEWTYNSGLFMSGAAFMYNHTQDPKWAERARRIWLRARVFFMDGTKIMYEAACQPTHQCDTNQRSFKGIFSRFLGLTCLMVPQLSDEIQAYLIASRPAAMASCSGGNDGHTCGLDWSKGAWDGIFGLGEQMSALESIQNTLVWTRPGPLREAAGGSSKSNGSAGTIAHRVSKHEHRVITSKDIAGASAITVVILLLMIMSAFLIVL